MSNQSQMRLVEVGSGGVISSEATPVLRNLIPKIEAMNPTLARNFALHFNVNTSSPFSPSVSEVSSSSTVVKMVELEMPTPLDDMLLNTERLEQESAKLQNIRLAREALVKSTLEDLQLRFEHPIDVYEYIKMLASKDFGPCEEHILTQTGESSTVESLFSENSSESSVVSRPASQCSEAPETAMNSNSNLFKDPNEYFPKSSRRERQMQFMISRNSMAQLNGSSQNVDNKDKSSNGLRTASTLANTHESSDFRRQQLFDDQNGFFPKSKRVRPQVAKSKK